MRSLAAAAVAFGVAACAGTPGNFAVWGPQSSYWAPVAPPPPRAEAMPSPSGSDVVWVPGYWRWENSRYRWTDGHWEMNRPNERWVGNHWEQKGNGQWRLEGGYWRRD